MHTTHSDGIKGGSVKIGIGPFEGFMVMHIAIDRFLRQRENSRCLTHLGWRFTKGDSQFFGLIGRELVPDTTPEH